MKLFSKLLATLLFGSLLFTSCHPKDQKAVASFLKTDKATLTVSAGAGKDSFMVSSNVTWTLGGLPTGFTSNISSGSTGDNKVVITYPANTTITSINADIIVTPTSGTSVSPVIVKLTQNASTPSLKTDSTVLNLKGSIGVIDSFNILTNIGWTISVSSSAASWLSVNAASGTNNKRIIVTTLQANTTNATRTGTITISTVNNANIPPVTIMVNQKPQLQLLWSKTFGGSSTDQFNSVIQTADGGYMAAGQTLSTDGDINSNKGSYDILVVKVDASGNIIWKKTYGGSDYDNAKSIIAAPDGYIISGETLSTDGDFPMNHGGYDMFAIKIDLTGNLIWEKTVGGTGIDATVSGISTADGYLFVGQTKSTNGDVPSNRGNFDIMVVKIALDGSTQWVKTFGGTNKDLATSIIQTKDGGYIVSGLTSSNDGDIALNHGLEDMVAIKIDRNGNKVWVQTYGGSGTDYVNSITSTTDGYLIAGTTSSVDGDIHLNHGGYDILVIKIDEYGNMVWEQTYGGSGYDEVLSIVRTQDGYVLTGDSNSIDGDIVSSDGFDDMIFIKIDDNGNKKLVKAFGGTGYDYANSIVNTPDGYIIAGYSNSTDGDIISNHGSYDAWIIKLKE